MYSITPGLVFGFHGCDKILAESVFSGKNFLFKSENAYDWLGHGIYFWENNFKRALEYAKLFHKTSGIQSSYLGITPGMLAKD